MKKRNVGLFFLLAVLCAGYVVRHVIGDSRADDVQAEREAAIDAADRARWQERDRRKREQAAAPAPHEAGVPEYSATAHVPRAEWKPSPEHALLTRDIRIERESYVVAIVMMGRIDEKQYAEEGLEYGCRVRKDRMLDRLDEFEEKIQVRYNLIGERETGECPQGTSFLMLTSEYMLGITIPADRTVTP